MTVRIITEVTPRAKNDRIITPDPVLKIDKPFEAKSAGDFVALRLSSEVIKIIFRELVEYSAENIDLTTTALIQAAGYESPQELFAVYRASHPGAKVVYVVDKGSYTYVGSRLQTQSAEKYPKEVSDRTREIARAALEQFTDSDRGVSRVD